MKKTKKSYEQYLNEIGCTYENCEYLTNKDRKKYLKPRSLKLYLSENRYGTVLRKYDPIAFEVGYDDYAR
jgi:hypothetical protein